MLLYGRYELSPDKQHGEKILGFRKNESLIFIKTYHKDENWLRVGNIKGKVGYIPKNYVGIINLPSPDHLLEFVTNATLSAKLEKLSTYQELKELSEKMEKQEFLESQTNLLLQVLDQDIDESDVESDVYTCTSTPEEDETTTCVNTSAVVTPRSDRFPSLSIVSLTSAENASKNIQTTKGKISKSLIPLPKAQSSKSKIEIPIMEGARESGESWKEVATNLTKIVKDVAEDLDLDQSKAIVQNILSHLNEFSNGMEEIIENLLRVFDQNSTRVSIDEASEEKLSIIMKYLTSLEPQNLHTLGYLEDESNVLVNLEQLRKELLNINAMSFERIIKACHHRWIHDLYKLYQDETRENIRNKLLEVFSMIATLDLKSGSIMLASALPLMLAKEMRSEKEQNNPKKLSRIANTLISILTTGDALPQSHLLEFGTEFLEFLLNHLDNDLCDDAKWKQVAVNLLLAINLQFSREDNLLIKTLAGRKHGRYLIESLLNLIDFQIDPIQGGHPQQDWKTVTNDSTSSTMKMVKDMFSSRITAEHFLTEDLQWLIDFIYNKISELRSGDRRRRDYLELLNLILKNRGFHHRLEVFKELFTAILLEDDPLSFSDQTIIKRIAKEFHVM